VETIMMGSADGKGARTFWGELRENSRDYSGNAAIPEGFIGISIDAVGGAVNGIFAALYVEDSGKAGILRGVFTGQYFEEDELWGAFGKVTADEMASGYIGHRDWDVANHPIDGYMKGFFKIDGSDGGSIYNTKSNGRGIGIADSSCGSLGSYTSWLKYEQHDHSGYSEKWGIFNIELGGKYDRPTVSNEWNVALSGDSWTGDHDYWFAGVDGNKWSDGTILGGVSGVWFKSANDRRYPNAVIAGKITGNVVGDYIEVGGESGTWTAISAGEWVEVTELLDQTKMFGANGLRELNNFVNVPVTEVYSNLLTAVAGACTGAITSAYANVSVFSVNNPGIMYDLFTAWGGGTVKEPMSVGSSANLTYGADNIIMRVTQVTEDKKFVVDLKEGTLNGQPIISGQGAGSFNDDSYSFVGAGTVANDNAGPS
jgi:hypothetical protein